jgi:PknH-like extracellular domain
VSAESAGRPSGVVTFVFTDVEGSTRRWEADADGMLAALAARNNVVIDVNNCSANPADTDVNIANQIAAKVPT